jgi:hypothetical protein
LPNLGKECTQPSGLLQIEYCPAGRKVGTLDRIDWRPHHDHNNKGRGLIEHRFKVISGCHHHQFSLNWFEAEGRMLKGNLPLAVPMEPKLQNQESEHVWYDFGSCGDRERRRHLPGSARSLTK